MGSVEIFKLWAVAALFLAAPLFIWMAFRSARKRGQAEMERRHAERSADMAQEALEIEDEVARLDGDALDSKLRR